VEALDAQPRTQRTTMVVAPADVMAAIVCATAAVPAAKSANSNAPIGYAQCRHASSALERTIHALQYLA
jgi:hypothetical protein